MAVNTVYYNKKMFEDAGLETPWELYKQDKWDWNAFAEAAEELTQDTNDDGEVDVYGLCFNRPVCWPYTTGEPFATMDSETMKPISNMDSQNIARSMNFIYDLINVKNLGYKTADTIELFGSGRRGDDAAGFQHDVPVPDQHGRAGYTGNRPDAA